MNQTPITWLLNVKMNIRVSLSAVYDCVLKVTESDFKFWIKNDFCTEEDEQLGLRPIRLSSQTNSS